MSHIHHTSHMDHAAPSHHHMSPVHHHMSPVHHHMSPHHMMGHEHDHTPYITIGFVVLSIILGLIAIVLGGLAVSGNINFFKVEASGNITSDKEITAKGAISTDTGFDVGQTKFTVDKDGDTDIAGTLTVKGASGFISDVIVNTDKFTVTGVNGNTDIAGTLGVTGATTLTGAATLSKTLGVTGATTLSSTLDITGNTTISGHLNYTELSVDLGTDLADSATPQTISWTSTGKTIKNLMDGSNAKIVTIAAPTSDDIGKILKIINTANPTGASVVTFNLTSPVTFDTASYFTSIGVVIGFASGTNSTFTMTPADGDCIFGIGSILTLEVLSTTKIRAEFIGSPAGNGNGGTLVFS